MPSARCFSSQVLDRFRLVFDYGGLDRTQSQCRDEQRYVTIDCILLLQMLRMVWAVQCPRCPLTVPPLCRPESLVSSTTRDDAAARPSLLATATRTCLFL